MNMGMLVDIAHAAETKTLVSDGLGLGTGNLGGYFNNLYELALLVGAVLAVLIIASAGLQYMSTDAISGKSESKTRITQALIGLLMLLGVWLFFNEIRPDILNLDFELEETSVQIQSDAERQAAAQAEREAELQRQREEAERKRREEEAAAAEKVREAQQALSAANVIPSTNTIDTGAGRLPNRYFQIVPKESGRVSCPASVSTLYVNGRPTGNLGSCSVGGPGTFDSDTQGCCQYDLDLGKL